jgi:hypothetical protein
MEDGSNKLRYKAELRIPYTAQGSPFYLKDPPAAMQLTQQRDALMQECMNILVANMHMTDLQVMQEIKVGRILWPFHSTQALANTRADGTEICDSQKWEWYIRTSTETKPECYDRYPANPPQRNAQGKPMPALLAQPRNDRLYGGCIVKAFVNPAWNKFRPGVSIFLNTIQHWADDDRIDGRIPASEVWEADENPPADMVVDPGQPTPRSAIDTGVAVNQSTVGQTLAGVFSSGLPPPRRPAA